MPPTSSAPTPASRRRNTPRPILGLIFLRFAEVRFAAQRAQAGEGRRTVAPRQPRRRTRRLPRRRHPLPRARGALRPPAERCPRRRTSAPRSTTAMRDIEKHNPQLAGVLPKTYNLFTSTLLKELLKKVSEIPASRGLRRLRAHLRILPRRVRPHRGPEGRRVLHADLHRPAARRSHRAVSTAASSTRPAARAACSCSARASSREHKKNPAAELSIYGVEKTDETGRLCR